jgi:5-formyltetrahydrofolate cyclo-ligase
MTAMKHDARDAIAQAGTLESLGSLLQLVPAEPAEVAALDKRALRRRQIALRCGLLDLDARCSQLVDQVAAFLATRRDTVLGAYWPIRGEPDLLPLLGAWLEAAPGRSVGLPVVDAVTSEMVFHGWHPGVRMEDDAFGIPTPQDTPLLDPTLLLVPCVGFGPGGTRLGYGGGFFDRALAKPGPRPSTAGIAYACSYVPDLLAEAHDIPLDVILTEDGIAWGPAG